MTDVRCEGCGEYDGRCVCDGYEGFGASDKEMHDVTPGPTDPEFKVKFETALFDYGCVQGVQAHVGSKRWAFKITHETTPAQAAQALRRLANWIEQQTVETAAEAGVAQAGGN